MSGLQLSELYIDFSIMPNPFYLFIGANGTGKTSILHCIHPFAYNSAVGDSVPSSEFILEGKDGQKEIAYSVQADDVGFDTYVINHVYTRNKDSMSVKSFIARNGEELNPSGTSGTFKELIWEIFELDESYLGLLSLGNSVSNFVEFTGATRKQLMSKIFTQIGVYSKYYKHASEKARTYKALLNNVTVKLDKYKGFDKENAKSVIVQSNTKIESLEKEMQELSTKKGALSQQMSTHEEFIKEYGEKKLELLAEVDRLDSLKKKVTTVLDEKALELQIADLDDQIKAKQINKGSYEMSLKDAVDYVQELNGSLTDLATTVQKMSTDVDLAELDVVIANLQDQLVSIDAPDEPKLDREKLVKSSIYLDELKSMCANFIAEIEYTDIIADTVKKYMKDAKLLTKSKAKYDKLIEDLKEMSYIKGTQTMIGSLPVLDIDYKCETTGCPYRQFYEVYKASVNKKLSEMDKDISIQQQKVDVAKDIVTAGNITEKIIKFIKMNESIFDLPSDVFNPETFIDLYMDKREVADLDLLGTLIDIAEKQELRQSLETQLEEAENKRKNNETLRSNFDMLQKQKESLEEKLERAKKSIEHYEASIPTFTEAIAQFEKIKKQAVIELETMREMNACKTKIDSIKKTLASMEDTQVVVGKLQDELASISSNIANIHSEIEYHRSNKSSFETMLKTVSELEKEQETVMDEYADAEIIKEAVSPTKGVQLERIKKFIKGDLIRMVNELLEVVYEDFRINPREVIINETEFTIPYRKNGYKASDISMASDGERAILSVAFALSLARITNNKYNVVLLDEKDTSLDVHSRGKYPDIIDAYRQLINCQQVFCVTHNSMFDSYPVNVIMTSDIEMSYQTDSVLQLWRKK